MNPNIAKISLLTQQNSPDCNTLFWREIGHRGQKCPAIVYADGIGRNLPARQAWIFILFYFFTRSAIDAVGDTTPGVTVRTVLASGRSVAIIADAVVVPRGGQSSGSGGGGGREGAFLIIDRHFSLLGCG